LIFFADHQEASMKASFLGIGVLSFSLLSASVISVKIFEIHVHTDARSEAKRDSPNVVVNPVPTSEPQIDPPTRISFHRGSTGETILGSVDRGRNYVLRAREGQRLSATVSSANNCIVFNSNTTTITFTTVRGDNWLGLVNNCGAQSGFSLTVSIL